MSLDADVTGARPPQQVLAWSRTLVQPALREAVEELPPTMRRIAGYHFGWWEADGTVPQGETPPATGKAVRPALALLSAEAVGGDQHAGLPAAVAVELAHNFSLIQDDLIDGDLTRHHRPTVWSIFGHGSAIVAGDALLTLAFRTVTWRTPHANAGEVLSNAAFALIDGQHADLAFEERADVEPSECLRMARAKSGSLLGCACALGAVFGGAAADQRARLHGFGEQLGVAFQIADDILGIWGDPAVTGKPVHSDLVRRKKTLPVVAALASGTAAGAALAELYHRDHPLSEEDAAHAAELVERAGGHRWCRRRITERREAAHELLQEATGGAGRAAAELGILARLAGDRDH